MTPNHIRFRICELKKVKNLFSLDKRDEFITGGYSVVVVLSEIPPLGIRDSEDIDPHVCYGISVIWINDDLVALVKWKRTRHEPRLELLGAKVLQGFDKKLAKISSEVEIVDWL